VAPAVLGAGGLGGSTGAWRSHSRRAYFRNEQPGSRFAKVEKVAPIWTTAHARRAAADHALGVAVVVRALPASRAACLRRSCDPVEAKCLH
jgi:hypothetical protein